MEMFALPFALAVVLAFVGFGQWLRQQRRLMIHRERLAALEKGVELPPLDYELQRSSWNVRRVLLLAGFAWISVGISFYLVFHQMIQAPTEATRDVPHGVEFVGIGLVGVGLSHLVALAAGGSTHK